MPSRTATAALRPPHCFVKSCGAWHRQWGVHGRQTSPRCPREGQNPGWRNAVCHTAFGPRGFGPSKAARGGVPVRLPPAAGETGVRNPRFTFAPKRSISPQERRPCSAGAVAAAMHSLPMRAKGAGQPPVKRPIKRPRPRGPLWSPGEAKGAGDLFGHLPNGQILRHVPPSRPCGPRNYPDLRREWKGAASPLPFRRGFGSKAAAARQMGARACHLAKVTRSGPPQAAPGGVQGSRRRAKSARERVRLPT